MQDPTRFQGLPAYAFPRLRALLDAHAPGGTPIHMTIGEPRHEPPPFVGQVLAETAHGFARYPPNDGTPELQDAIAGWLRRRYGVEVDPRAQVLPLNGTREGLFAAGVALFPEGAPKVLVPNPFYQVYAVAALAVGAEPVYVPATAGTGFLPDYRSLPPEILNATAAAWICSPANPQGSVADAAYWRDLLDLAETYDFRILADECYSEIWRDAPPVGALEAAKAAGANPERVTVFHSLSKRSNLPGLRSGFAAGGPGTVARLKQLRAYAGAPLPGPIQAVSARAWSDEAHVEASLARYHAKFEAVSQVFAEIPAVTPPAGGFFLWLPVEDGEDAALRLWRETGVRALPGAYLAREVEGRNPGAGYLRVALVGDEDETRRGLTLIRDRLFD